MPKQKHIHKYERTEVGNKGWVVYRCVTANCSHYLPSAPLIVGKNSLCWGVCEGTVVYTQDDYNNKLKRPMCSGCRAIRQAQKDALKAVPESQMEVIE